MSMARTCHIPASGTVQTLLQGHEQDQETRWLRQYQGFFYDQQDLPATRIQ